MRHAEVLELATKVTAAYLRKLPRRGVGKAFSPEVLAAKLNLKIPEHASAIPGLEADLESYLQHSVGTLDPGFMNQLFSGLNPWAMAGEVAALATNSTMATFEATPVATLMEKELVKLLAQYAGWKDHDGIMVTGGSNANLVGLLMARNRLHPEIRENGPGEKKLVAYVSAESHYSFEKAVNILGLGTRHLRLISTDPEGRLRVDLLAREIERDRDAGRTPFFIGATAGTTVLGAFDPIRDIAKVAKDRGLWLHVDGAWGGSVLVSQTHRGLMDGIEEADSLGWDNHKMLGTGVVSSFFLTRHPSALLQSHSGGGADYIFHDSDVGRYDIGKSSLQCGRRTDSVKTWFAWRALGRQGMSAHVDALMALAQEVAALIAEDQRFELIAKPSSLNVCFSLRNAPAEDSVWFQRLRQKLMAEGRFMVNIASRERRSFVRLIVVNPDLKMANLRDFLDDLARLAQET